jgi:hypothetical protein
MKTGAIFHSSLEWIYIRIEVYYRAGQCSAGQHSTVHCSAVHYGRLVQLTGSHQTLRIPVELLLLRPPPPSSVRQIHLPSPISSRSTSRSSRPSVPPNF